MNRHRATPKGDLMADKLPIEGEEPMPGDPITRCLRLVYSEVASEPLPDELARLIEELEGKGEGNGAPDG